MTGTRRYLINFLIVRYISTVIQTEDTRTKQLSILQT